MEGGRWRPHLVVWEACGSGANSARHGPPLKGIAAPSEPPGGLWGACGGGSAAKKLLPKIQASQMPSVGTREASMTLVSFWAHFAGQILFALCSNG